MLKNMLIYNIENIVYIVEQVSDTILIMRIFRYIFASFQVRSMINNFFLFKNSFNVITLKKYSQKNTISSTEFINKL